MLALDRALGGLERASPDLARLVELRFFAGLSLEEIAPIVERSERSLGMAAGAGLPARRPRREGDRTRTGVMKGGRSSPMSPRASRLRFHRRGVSVHE